MRDHDNLPLFAWTHAVEGEKRKTAELFQFPHTRRAAFIARHAERMMDLPSTTAEKHLAYTVRVQAQTMAKRGFSQDAISHHTQALEHAIRAAIWRMILTPGGAA